MSRATPGQQAAVGLLLLSALVILAYLAVQVGAWRVETGHIEVGAVFDNAGGVGKGAVVSVAGVDVGQVTELWVEGGRAHMILSVRDDVPLGRDVKAAVRARSVLGEKYVQLIPGAEGAGALQDGDVISFTEGQVEIDEMVNTMGPLVGAVDPDALAVALDALGDALSQDPERMERMLDDSEALLRNLRLASEEAPAAVRESRAAVAELRDAVASARPLIGRTERLLSELERAAGPLAEASQEAPLLAQDARQAVADGRRVMERLEGSAGDLEVVLQNLRGFDMLALRRLFREEGVLVRLRESEVQQEQAGEEE